MPSHPSLPWRGRVNAELSVKWENRIKCGDPNTRIDGAAPQTSGSADVCALPEIYGWVIEGGYSPEISTDLVHTGPIGTVNGGKARMRGGRGGWERSSLKGGR